MKRLLLALAGVMLLAAPAMAQTDACKAGVATLTAKNSWACLQQLNGKLDRLIAAPAPTPTPTPVPTPTNGSALPTWAGVTIYNGDWSKDWNTGNHNDSSYGYVFDPRNVSIDSAGNLHMVVTENPKGGAFVQRSGGWQNVKVAADVTWAPFRPGLVQAPLYFYWDPQTGEEIDWEMAGSLLVMTIHGRGGGTVWTANIPANLVKARNTVEIEYHAGQSVTYRLDGAVVANITKAQVPGIPSGNLKPIIDTKPAGWAGAWTPLPAGQTSDMIIHGFAVTPLP